MSNPTRMMGRWCIHFFTLAALLITALHVGASERAIIIFKNEAALRSVFPEGRSVSQFQDMRHDSKLSQVRGNIEEVLRKVDGAIVEVESEKDLELLRQHSAIAFVEKEIFHPLPAPVSGKFLPQAFRSEKSPDLDFLNSLSMPYGISLVKAPEAWELSLSGSNARVAVLDTGIDRDHPALKENFEAGKDHVGGNEGPYEYFDSHGHGTHVAGTIAAKKFEGGFSGVAPLARILAGRVCGSLGCPNTSVAKGINWAVEQKVDVINMSLGGALSTNAEKTAVAAAEAAGVVVVAASGNNGNGKVSFPAALPTVIAVGAVDAAKKKTSFSQWGPELDVVAPGASVLSSVPVGTGRDSIVSIIVGGEAKIVKSSGFGGAKEAMEPVKAQIIDAGLGKPADFAKGNFVGKFALIQRGEITFADKIKNAISAGASGVILYNNVPGLVQGSLTSDGSILQAYVAMIEKTVGEEIKAQLADPQVIEAQIETLRTDYAQFDGTSMASPHAAGVVALIKSANKNLTPAQVREILKSTAETLTPNQNNEYGSGLVNAETGVLAAKKAMK